MRILASTLLTLSLMAAGCEKNDPLFCQMNPGASGCPDASVNMHDSGIDGDADPTIDARLDFGEGAYAVHLAKGASVPLTFTDGATLDTTNSMQCEMTSLWVNSAQPNACFVVATNISMVNLRVTGDRPLVLIATNNLSITGQLDAASHVAGTPGPGSPVVGVAVAPCQGGTAAVANSAGGGGGAGGSFVTKGADGGSGGGVSNKGLAANADLALPNYLRAGCNGQVGADGNGGGAGPQGRGGGSVFLLAGNTITLATSAIINVSGGGAPNTGLTTRGGAGGGGSGGMLVLYAGTSIAAPAGSKLVANGGGGAGGANGGGGGAGSDPDPASPTTPAGGGNAGGSCTGDGGSGYAAADANGGTSAPSGCGGGGGGGAAGYIQTNFALPNVTASPTVTGP